MSETNETFDEMIQVMDQTKLKGLKLLANSLSKGYNKINHSIVNKITSLELFKIFIENYNAKEKLDETGFPLWYYLLNNQHFLVNEWYRYVNINYNLPTYIYHYCHYVAYDSLIPFDVLYRFFKFLKNNGYHFPKSNGNSVLDLIFDNAVYLSETISDLLALLLEVETAKKENYLNYIFCKAFIKANRQNKQIEHNQVNLNEKILEIEDYKKLSKDDKKTITDDFENSLLHNYYGKGHPLTWAFDIYYNIVKQIMKFFTDKNSAKLVIGESLNKLGLMMELLDSTKYYYLPFSGRFYERRDLKFVEATYKEYILENRDNINYLYLDTFNEVDKFDTIYLIDYAYSGAGILSFVKIIQLLKPELLKKIVLVLTIDDRLRKDAFMKEIKQFGVRVHTITIPYQIMNVFYDELYSDRCMKSVNPPKFKNKITSIYHNNLLQCNIVRFYIIHKILGKK